MGHPLWPLFDLRLRTARLELRLPTDDDLVQLAALARRGVHPPGSMPFAVPWSTLPSPQFERGFVQFHWTARGTWRPERWTLDLMATRDGVPIGMQGLGAVDFATLRTVSTGSWLGLEFQRRGFGTEMRAAVLALAFDGLDAEAALTEARTDNQGSQGVSRALGYEENGIGRLAPEGVAVDTTRFRMTRERWRARPRDPVEVIGLERCLDLFGPPTEAPRRAADAAPTEAGA
jgi:RimJ/RimL family protein N-acetyltransferase